MPILQAVPVLRSPDVARSMAWYREMLGFSGDPFPPAPPHAFALLRLGSVELMLRHGPGSVRPTPRPYDWDAYLRFEGPRFRELHRLLGARGVVFRELERMGYGTAEFEVIDPDGHTLCLGRPLEAGDSDLPSPRS